MTAPALPAGAPPPTKCQNCGFSSRHSRQKPGETPLFVRCCNAFMCAGCRKLRDCVKPSEPTVDARARYDLQAAVPPNDGMYARVPESVYHGDRNSLSSSGARMLLDPSCPALFRQNQDEPPNPKPQYDFGHAAHKMVLGEGSQLVRVDKDDWRTNEAKAKRAKAWEEGKAPLLAKDIELAQVMAGRVFAHPIAGRLLEEGSAEMSGYWHDDATGVRCRFRPDWLPKTRGRMVCLDYKTAVSANPNHFRKAAADYGYHQQAAWYLDGLREVEVSDDAAFLFVVQQKTAPFLVSVVQLEPEDIEAGRRLNRRAIDVYAQCVETNTWPGFGDGIHTVGLPPWARTQISNSLEGQPA